MSIRLMPRYQVLVLNDIHEFKPLVEHTVFIEQLKQKHGLKRSFWDRVL